MDRSASGTFSIGSKNHGKHCRVGQKYVEMALPSSSSYSSYNAHYNLCKNIGAKQYKVAVEKR